MKVSYKVRIKYFRTIFYDTIKIYRKCIKFIIKVVEENYDSIKDLKGKFQNTYIKNLIHSTKNNKAKYPDFDKEFYKFPSYLRRDCIASALGIYKSYYSNYQNWLESDKRSNPPKLIYNHNEMPVLYKGNMYEQVSKNLVNIKLFYKNDWVWITVPLKRSDVKYIDKYNTWEMSNPSLEIKGKVWALRFAFEKDIKLKELPLEQQVAIGVDLNVKNTSAVCSAIKSDGTVLSRKFINCGSEKDHFNKALQIKVAVQKRSNIKKMYDDEPNIYDYNNYKSYYRMIDYANKNFAIAVSRQIIEFAVKNNAYVIVFEHLNKKGKKSFLKERLHYWNYKMIQSITTSLAHKIGIHVNTVCAYGTSKFAFDGSGIVTRHNDNRSICTFTTGKVFNADLNASFNIASRYFIREIQKSHSKTDWLALTAKFPECAKRSTCTLSTLISISTDKFSPTGKTMPA